MWFILQITDGAAAGKTVAIQPNHPCRVGRADGAELVIANDGLLSRSHFVVECSGESSCRVRDLNSTNGTFVNGQRITEAEISEVDTLVAGRTTFAVHPMDGEPAALPEDAAAEEAEAVKKALQSTQLAMKPYNPPEPPPEPPKE
jgi:pSer/pThr/pTyr-binding forkhead associated (FHA) protein